jgi:hypothetical protein
MNGSPTFRKRQVRDTAEKVREANELITKALRAMIRIRGARVPGQCRSEARSGRRDRQRAGEHCFREAGAGRSNPVTPTADLRCPRFFRVTARDDPVEIW